jgi:hypothetical protein
MTTAFLIVLAILFTVIGILYRVTATVGGFFMALVRMPSKESLADVWIPKVLFTLAGLSLGWALLRMILHLRSHIAWT